MSDDYVFNIDVAKVAIRLALPTIEAMVPAISWGPPGAAIAISGPEMADPYKYVMHEIWLPGEWEGMDADDFEDYAVRKHNTSRRTGTDTENVLINDPAGLHALDTLYPGGGVLGSLVCGVSGFKGWGDKYAEIVVLICAQTLCRAIVEAIRSGEDGIVGECLEEARKQVLENITDGWAKEIAEKLTRNTQRLPDLD